MPDDKRADREEGHEESQEPKPGRREKDDLKDLDITDEAAGALKGGIPKQPDVSGY